VTTASLAPMRRGVRLLVAAVLLTGATALAFFSGGYFTEPRVIAALVAWVLVLALAVTGPAPLPHTSPGRIALAGLGLMTAWTAASIAWAPLAGAALGAIELLLLYCGALLLAVGALRERAARRAVEPALAAGATVVIGYGLAGRLLPGLVHLSASKSALGRLEQPITYWNGEGALAAIGLVLCARIAGDRSRPAALRGLAAAAAVPLGAGVYLSYSRGAIAAAAVGLVVLVAAAPSRAQLRAAAVVLGAGIAAAVACAPFPAVASLAGDGTREGAIVLVLLVVLALAASWAALGLTRAPEPARPPRGLRNPAPIAAAVALLVVAGLVVGGIGERPSARELAAGASAGRLTSASSNRYEYWRVALRAFEQEPLRGLGAGGFQVFWLQQRTIPEAVHDTHSLELEMAAELGLVGLLALVLLIGGVAASARRALGHDRAAAAGATAALVVWFLHASIDWDWQLPAVSLPAIVLAGAVLVLSERERSADPAAGARRAPAAPRPDPVPR
jgi:O-Antigen ligase